MLFVLFCFQSWRLKDSHMLHKHSLTEIHLQPLKMFCFETASHWADQIDHALELSPWLECWDYRSILQVLVIILIQIIWVTKLCIYFCTWCFLLSSMKPRFSWVSIHLQSSPLPFTVTHLQKKKKSSWWICSSFTRLNLASSFLFMESDCNENQHDPAVTWSSSLCVFASLDFLFLWRPTFFPSLRGSIPQTSQASYHFLNI